MLLNYAIEFSFYCIEISKIDNISVLFTECFVPKCTKSRQVKTMSQQVSQTHKIHQLKVINTIQLYPVVLVLELILLAISNSAACDQEQTAAILKLEGNKLCLC